MAKTIKNRLLIHFHDNNGERISWSIHSNGGKNFPVYHGKLSDIDVNALFHQVIVLVPSSEIFITTVTLPNISATQQAQAALYVLEEQLADDVQSLHAIVIPQDNQNHHTAVIVDKNLLTQWTTLLRENNIVPTLVLPDIFALPSVNDGWSILLWKNMAWVKTGPKIGFSIEANTLSTLIADLPARIEIKNYSGNPIPAPFNTITPTQTLTHDNPSDLQRFLFAQNLPGEANLLTGEFTSAIDKAYSRKRWKTPAILLTTLLLIYSSSITAQWLYLSHTNNALQQQITDLYKQVFPNATSVISPKARIDQEIQSKQTNLNNDEFLFLLAQAGKALAQQQNIVLDSIAFQNDELILHIDSKSLSDLDKLHAALKQQTIQVEQKDTSSTKNSINAEFHIKRAT